MGDTSSIMRYRTLRIHYIVEVLPSLDVSFHISPCPSKLQEYLVRMDVVNKTRSESFKLHQLSAFENEWKISLFQPIDTIFPSESLMAGQGLSCFFKLKNDKKSATGEDNASSLSTLVGADVSLSPGSNEAMFDVYSSPLIDFHHCERLHQRASEQGHQTVDFILIYQPQRSNKSSGLPQTNSLSIISSHHACHCSVASTSPICWLMDGPRAMHHNFTTSLCEIRLRMTIHNSSDVGASVRVNTFDSTLVAGSLSTGSSAFSGNEAGWHDLPLSNDVKVTSAIVNTGVRKSISPECVPPFIWSGSSSTRVKLEPKSTIEIPLLICVFSAGTYDLSNYTLHWNLLSVEDARSGICHGHPYYLTVLQHDD